MKIIKILILLVAFPLMSYADSSLHKIILMQGFVIDQSVNELENLEICNNGAFMDDSRCIVDYSNSRRKKTTYSIKLFSDDKLTMNVTWDGKPLAWWEGKEKCSCSFDLITKGNNISAVLTKDSKNVCFLRGDPNTDSLELFIRYEG